MGEEKNYWLCICNSENANIVKERKIWGVSERHKNTIGKVGEGDFLVLYTIMEKSGEDVTQPKIRGVYKAASEPFAEYTRVFKSRGKENELFPRRVKLEPVYVPENPTPFRELIPKLGFITNKEKWHTHLFGRAMRTIPKTDFETIFSALKEEWVDK
ncbi:EVE domain-containing protein [ANME-1 cluster archaeon GoMg4]|nr:EVE domain-containing protein [ANME-1 cluster archaeon GoMg4]